MLKQELIHSHIIVAIFCGWEPQKPNKEFPNGSLFLSTGDTPEDQNEVSNDDILGELPYATDWNYLMAAWEVFTQSNDTISGADKKDIDLMEEIAHNVETAILEVNIDLAFKELVRGVNALNQLKLQES